MADTIQEVIEVVTRNTRALNDLIRQNEELADSADEANRSTRKQSEGMKLLQDAVTAYISLQAAKHLKEQTIELGKLAAKTKFVAKNFQNFATNEGKNFESMMGSMRSATQGMISDLELQQMSMQAMIGGVNFDDLITSMQFVSRQALATGQDVSSKMQTVMTGLARGSAQFLDDVGIQVMGAKDVVGAAVEQMKEKMGIFADATSDSHGQIEKANAEIKNMKNEIGENLIPATLEWFKLLSKIARKTREILVEGIKGSDINAKWIAENKIHESLRDQFSVMNKIKKLKAFEDIKKQADEYNELNKDFNMMEESLASMTTRTLVDLRKRNAIEDEMVNVRKEQESIDLEIAALAGGKIKSAFEFNRAIEDGTEFMKKMRIESEKVGKFDFSKKDQDSIDAAKELAELRAQAQIDHDKAIAKWREDLQLKVIKDREKNEEESREYESSQIIAFNNKVINDAIVMEGLITQIKKDGVQQRLEAEALARDQFLQSSQMMISGINQISKAKQQSIQLDSRKEIEAIQKSTMSEKKKSAAIDKINKKTTEERKKAANVAWAATSALSIANATFAVIDTIKDSPGGAFSKLAAGALVGATVFGLAAQVAASKPKFFNGGDVPFNGNNRDTQEVLVRSGEKILNPVDARRYDAGITNNKKSVSNTYITINADAGVNTDQLEAVIRSTLPRALEDETRTNAIDWDRVGVMTR